MIWECCRCKNNNKKKLRKRLESDSKTKLDNKLNGRQEKNKIEDRINETSRKQDIEKSIIIPANRVH